MPAPLGSKAPEPVLPVGEVVVDADGRVPGFDAVNYACRSFRGALTLASPVLEDLVKDCRAAFVMRSFWMPADGTPRFALEHIAQQIFRFHAKPVEGLYDPARSGAEWWVHFRGPKEEYGEHIGFHWDKDERYADATKKFIHPHVATVTYLSDAGAPTMVVHHQPMAFRGTESVRHAFISHPRLGKHMSFDGRLLHGVPPELIAPRTPSSYTRITVLVNVWLNHSLTGVERWPEETAPSLSAADSSQCVLKLDEVTEHAGRPTALKPPPGARVRGFAFGAEGEEHELWVPELPSCTNDSQDITIGASVGAKVVRVGGPSEGGGKKKPKKK